MVAAWAPKHRDAGARDGRLGRGAARLHALCEARAGSLATAGAAGFPAPPPPSPTRLDRSPALRDARLLALASGSSRYQLVVPGSSPCLLGRQGRKRRLFTQLGCPVPPPARTAPPPHPPGYCFSGTAPGWLPAIRRSHLLARPVPPRERRWAPHSRLPPKPESKNPRRPGRNGEGARTSSGASRSPAAG